MGVSPTNSNIYVNLTSIFSQDGGNKGLSIFQATGSYANGAFQIRGTRTSVSDVLDLSPEGMAALEAAAEAQAVAVPDDSEAAESTSENGAVDTTLQSNEMSDLERVETIRLNKNSVLERVRTLLEEKGIEYSAAQPFTLTTNLMDGSVTVEGIEDPELLAAFDEALAGDEELVSLMRKTRNELGLPEQGNTIPRNFTIEFASMEDTPANAEIEFRIDVFVNQTAQPLVEGETDQTESSDQDQAATTPLFQMSILLSNRIKPDASSMLLEQLESSANQSKGAVKEKGQSQGSEEIEEEEKEKIDSEESDKIVMEETPEESSAQTVDASYADLGTHFQSQSEVLVTEEGFQLNWQLRFADWDLSRPEELYESQRKLYESMDLSGSTSFLADPQSDLSVQEQADHLKSLFDQGVGELFSRNTTSDWTRDFLVRSGLGNLVSG